MNSLTRSSQTVLILAPMANDGALAQEVLESAGISAVACPNIDDLCTQMRAGCGAVVISEEALEPESIRFLQDVLDQQDTWSDLPVLLLTNIEVVRAAEMFSKAGNISLLERPFSRLTLIRLVEVALRARKKQYEVRDLMARLERARSDAERANFAKSQFLANMSHEIRTPIGAIMGFVELMKSPETSPEQQRNFMAVIDRNSQQLLRLIDDILDLSKVEAGKLTIEQMDFNLRDFINDFATVAKLRAVEKGLELRFNMATQLPTRISTDPVRLRQILSNIIGNAIKFTDQGGIDISVSYQGTELKIIVRDTGIGLSETQIGKLFRPFAQADSTTTRRFGGTGLGLVLSRKLAEALGGKLELVSSAPNSGSTFEIVVSANEHLLPKSTAVVLPMAPLVTTTVGDENELRGLKVLLVEDSPDNQFIIEAYLKRTGAFVDVMSNGAEGSDAALKNNYDLILMDIQMPLMDGHAATQKLRKLNYQKPIIALTAHAMSEERQRCLASGFTDYLTKPIQKSQLISVLKRFQPVDAATPF